jgi:hypothetical protein
MCGANITENGCKYISKMLSKNQSLRELDLGSIFFKDDGCKFLCEGLSKNSTLELLNIERKKNLNSKVDCDIESEGCKYLYKALRDNKSLKVLHMSCNTLFY